MSSFSSSLSIRHPSLCFLLAREVLDLTGPHAMLGNTSLELNKIVQEACVERNSYPSPFGCPRVSQNLPASRYPPEARPLEEGDIASLDVTLSHEG
ncbi:hypothetical protein PSTG_15336 [Puccinia striiformis f. sp. tritici PST-78]|uniref:Peptidase M24 domain-containing protein n=1 Tax=Puccinia striiformis f. sp. tritici PST-78 TaxID=1165861 RepID=A0A0L0UWW3_9BASI|nr:hypothetical protein PSTG_15336 [Puccinia striiformis f. sp. tritici PST-78]